MSERCCRALRRRPGRRRPPTSPRCSGRRSTTVWLEIGFGGGEHLLPRPRATPTSASSAASPSSTAWPSCWRVVEQRRSTMSASTTTTRRELLRLAAGRVARPGRSPLSRSLAEAAPPQAPLRRRTRCSAALARVLQPGGEFRFATDIDDYVDWTLQPVLRSRRFRLDGRQAADDWRKPFAGLAGHPLRGKALREGRSAAYLDACRAGRSRVPEAARRLALARRSALISAVRIGYYPTADQLIDCSSSCVESGSRRVRSFCFGR